MKREKKAQSINQAHATHELIGKERKILKIQTTILTPGSVSLVLHALPDIQIVYQTLEYVSAFKRVAYVALRPYPMIADIVNLYTPRVSLKSLCQAVGEYDIVCVDATQVTPHFKDVVDTLHHLPDIKKDEQSLVTLYIAQ